MLKNKPIIVVGGGHAGVEAALAISRLGGKVIIVTMDLDAIARMSCNPAIGGLAKGHLVKEIDALGGIMSKAADFSGIQFKMLNKSKGRAVWSPRAQVDKIVYSQLVSDTVKSDPNISLLPKQVVNFKTTGGAICSAVFADGSQKECSSIIITSGTFMNGLIHIGENTFKAGRIGEKASIGLTGALVERGFRVGRLKTGTPPRALKTSIDWTYTQIAPGDLSPSPFSIMTEKTKDLKNIPCHIINTNKQSHDVLENNLRKSAIFSGKIKGVGPRYCPSIEDKIVRFSERKSHQLFLEPEWFNSNQIYINGFSTSMPEEIQVQALRKIKGFKNIQLIRPGYAIEYDYFPSSQLKSTLETKKIKGLFLAGQINGTSGYEEAAAQGLIAGINAQLSILKKEPFLVDRSESYIGVLIDDLITKTIDEPYRMFTSRAEHRLSLRPDTASLRITPKAVDCGLIPLEHKEKFSLFENEVSQALQLMDNLKTDRYSGKKASLSSLIVSKKTTLKTVKKDFPELGVLSSNALFTAETDILYRGYVNIENKRVKKIKQNESIKIPTNFNYQRILSLSTEARQKLSEVRPETLGQASRIGGVRTSDVAVLNLFLKTKQT